MTSGGGADASVSKQLESYSHAAPAPAVAPAGTLDAGAGRADGAGGARRRSRSVEADSPRPQACRAASPGPPAPQPPLAAPGPRLIRSSDPPPAAPASACRARIGRGDGVDAGAVRTAGLVAAGAADRGVGVRAAPPGAGAASRDVTSDCTLLPAALARALTACRLRLRVDRAGQRQPRAETTRPGRPDTAAATRSDRPELRELARGDLDLRSRRAWLLADPTASAACGPRPWPGASPRARPGSILKSQTFGSPIAMLPMA